MPIDRGRVLQADPVLGRSGGRLLKSSVRNILELEVVQLRRLVFRYLRLFYQVRPRSCGFLLVNGNSIPYSYKKLASGHVHDSLFLYEE